MIKRHVTRFTFVISCMILLVQLVQAQDAIFSQFYAAPLQLNPAFAGNTYSPLININYRNQWSALPTAYETYSVSYDQFFEKLRIGAGVLLTVDDAGNGLFKTNRLTGIFSYHIKTRNDFSLRLGVEAGAIQTRLDWERYIFYDQLHPETGPINPSGSPIPTNESQPDFLNKTFFDASAGILVHSRQFYGGITLKHINTPDDTYLNVNDQLHSGWPMRTTVHAGMEIILTEGNKRNSSAFISPNVMYIMQRDFAQLNVGAYASIGPIFSGLWYRQAFTNSDALIFLLGFQKGFFKLGYSYDYTVSSLSNSLSGGSHELSLSFNFDTNRPRRADYNDCFNMFR